MVNVVCPAGLDGRRRFGDTSGTLGGSLAYLSGLSAFGARELTGDYAPQIGQEKMEQLLPDDWVGVSTGAVSPMQAINAWCGGQGIPARRKLVWDTGGHTDNRFNGWWMYDFNEVNGRPVGMSLVPNTLSDYADTPGGDGGTYMTYSDGRQGAVHSYGGWFRIDNQTVVRSCGAAWHSGNSSNKTFRHNIDTGVQVEMAVQTASTGTGRYMFALHVPGEQYALLLQTSTAGYERLDVTAASGVGSWNGSWISAGGSGWGQYPAIVHDTLRDRVITLDAAAGGGVQVFSRNGAAGTITYVGTATMTGDTEIFTHSGLSAFYDDALDSIWVFGGSEASGAYGYSSIYQIDAAAFDSLGGVAITANALSVSLPVVTGCLGSFGRYVPLLADRAIGFLPHGDRAPFVIKLPDAA